MNASTGFDLLAPGAATAFVLTMARIGGLVLVAPMYSARTLPATLRTALVIVLAILLQPMARTHASPTLAITPATIIGESLIGFIVGFGAALLIAAAEAAGELLSAQIGLSGAALMDPLSLQQSTALGQFMNLLALTLLLAGNGHLVMLDALAGTFQHLPIGGALQLPDGMQATVLMGSELFALGFKFASPVIAVIMVTNVALAVLSRAAPQLNILQLAFPVQIAVGLFAFTASIPIIAGWFIGWDVTYSGMLTRLVSVFAGAGGR
ncbi:MAG: flagellar biosynthetic protein FliR [Gemmatimonadaceae bacterium]